MISYPNCKINLGLHVVGKRPDGYHDLETLFVPVHDLCDELEITPLNPPPSQGGAPARGRESLMVQDGIALDNDPDDNLCMRAWRLLHDEFAIPPVSIRLKKGIPFGAGLGGGSADAAFTLKMLNEMFSLHLSDSDLEHRAARLGADCAFFIRNQAAYATGIGDRLEPIALDLSPYRIVIEIPAGEHVSTKEAYAGLSFSNNSPSEIEGVDANGGRGRMTSNTCASPNSPSKIEGVDANGGRGRMTSNTCASPNSPSKIEGVDANGGRGRMTSPSDQPPIHTHNKPYLKSARRELRSYGTSAEACLWNRLKQKKLFDLQFRRQFSIENYILDFYCPSLKLAIELDGEVHNEQQEHDIQRDSYLRDIHSITVLRYENKVVFERPNYIVEDIQHYMQCKSGISDIRPCQPQAADTPSNLEGDSDTTCASPNSPSKIEGVDANGGRGRMTSTNNQSHISSSLCFKRNDRDILHEGTFSYAPAHTPSPLRGTPPILGGDNPNSPSEIEGVDANGGRGRMTSTNNQSRTLSRPDLREAVKRPIGEWKDCIVNDFEASVFPSHPAIAALKDDLYRRGALYASMTGSGAAVFGIFFK
ncbi:MAG: DUF559 domain-containing protein [Bacteroidales bacterium]|nr:DUF559 domain-containing protein [Bacteroidales bacterium]